jgi:enoyl-CoA hydratase/carnithine racemase
MGELVRLEVESGVGTIRLDRPPMNAVNAQLRAELQDTVREAGARADVAAVVVYGGEKVFAAGADIKEMVGVEHVDMIPWAEKLQGALEELARLPKPTIAAITGYALGGGCELALACDFRVCGDNARLGQPEILLGVIPGAGGTQRLARLVGPARAKDLVFSGRFVDAAEALAIGLVDKVVAPDDVYSAAVAMASTYVGGPALALRAAKAAIDGGLDGDLSSGLRLETQLFISLFATEDRRAGMRSFIENGPGKARFTGR